MTDDAPSLNLLKELQLFRTTLVNFLEWKNFEDVIKGCYVRVLLEMRNTEDRDKYYIACVRGAKKGNAYSGFSAEGQKTEWHITVELPYCFKSTQTGNVVQLNSISNTPFQQGEYQSWVEMIRASKQPFPGQSQLQFRLGMLQEQKKQSLAFEPKRQKRTNEDPREAELREQRQAEMKEAIRREIVETHVQMPLITSLKVKPVEELQEIECELLDLITNVRLIINERAKCMKCRNRVCTEICYPCKHQVLCKDCAAQVAISKRCPVPECTIPVEKVFEPYTSR